MKRYIALLVLLMSNFAFAQNYTNITVTSLTDSQGQVWANGTWRAEIIPPFGNGNPLNNKGTSVLAAQTGAIDGAGSFTATLDDNLVVTPSNSHTRFTLCPNATVASCSVITTTVTGATQNLSATLNAGLVPITIIANPTIPRTYADTQATGGSGSLFWRVSDNTLRGCNSLFCNGANWNNVAAINLHIPGNIGDTTPGTIDATGIGLHFPGTGAFTTLSATTLSSTTFNSTGATIGATGFTVTGPTLLNSLLDSVQNTVRIAGSANFPTIQLAITDACAASPVAPVFVIPGTYPQNTSFTLCEGLKVKGAGRKSVTISTTLSAGDLFPVTDMHFVELSGFKILKTGTAGGNAFHLNYAQYLQLNDFEVNGNFTNGIVYETDANGSTIYNHITNGTITGVTGSCQLWKSNTLGKTTNGNQTINLICGPNSGAVGINFDSAAVASIAENVWIGGEASGGVTGINVATNQARDNFFYGMTVESNTGTGYNVVSGAERTQCYGSTIDSNGTNVVDVGTRSIMNCNVAGTIQTYSLNTIGDLTANSIGGISGWPIKAGSTVAAIVNSTNPTFSATTFTVGGGSTVSEILLGNTISLNSPFTAIAANTCQEQAITLTGVNTGGVATVSPTSSLGTVYLIWSARIPSGNVVNIRMCNPSAGSITPNVATWNALVFQ